jgi:hypothetical protein
VLQGKQAELAQMVRPDLPDLQVILVILVEPDKQEELVQLALRVILV